jgi:hypothetical protein
MIQLLEPSPGLLSGSTTPLRRDDPDPNLVKSDSLSRRWRGVRRWTVGSSVVDSKLDAVGRRTKLPRRDDAEDGMAGEGGVAVKVGVAVPEETAESPELAGVEGGGRGPAGESLIVDHGRGRAERYLWLS